MRISSVSFSMYVSIPFVSAVVAWLALRRFVDWQKTTAFVYKSR